MLVEVQVSSTQTNPEKSMPGWTVFHAARRRATSDLCCSVARRVFLEALALRMNEGPHSLVIDLQARLPLKLISKTLQREVTRLHPGQHPVTVRPDNLLRPVATDLRRRNAARLGMPGQPVNHSRCGDPKPRRHLVPAFTCRHKLHRAITHFHRIRLGHSCWPPLQWPA